MRLVKDTTGKVDTFHIRGTIITLVFNKVGQYNYTRVDDEYVHHFQFYPGFEVLPEGAKIPTVDVKEKKVDNKDIKTESLKKKS